MFSPLLLSTMAMGGLILLIGVITSNAAVVEMSKRLNNKYPNLRQKQWWEVIGNGATGVIREYKRLSWSDLSPTKSLSFGYKLIAAGLVILLGASVLGNYLRGTL